MLEMTSFHSLPTRSNTFFTTAANKIVHLKTYNICLVIDKITHAKIASRFIWDIFWHPTGDANKEYTCMCFQYIIMIMGTCCLEQHTAYSLLFSQ